ncbi:hypothetical protein [Bradyrhizobium guangdongense]|uniref:Uncharacterized protein n=1 Tax=Bradyrhizobium guangdongense TaxID=1325090 RepID=A0A410VDD7_9BRAD|nr:hypothetical protein [Bradyrhizobium guangdongense]QAU41638.1 hypothetical protein X265_31115 [Bradyrhizobium guangdongense]QOZ62701.1 hypothetical protein XH86_31155 [Bradyrhizobium guangdongense]GGI33091.1 hypothetical protein GCM10010987_72660 [Bradyrhizobium guangdongense]
MRRAATRAVAVIMLGASGVGAYQLAGQPATVSEHWREIAWPFPRDGWPAGRAFRCEGGACDGAALYLRAKRGFCNCDSGVADDDEVDRVADIDLITPRFRPTAPGELVHVGEMHGRARAYDLATYDGAGHAAVGIAVSRRCDLFVAAAQGRGDAGAMQQAALVFLETPEIKSWAMAALDGK